MLAGLSHDIRTPLTSLDGYLQLLAGTDDPQKRAYYVKIMQERVVSLSNILENLFTYAKLEQEEYALAKDPVNLHECLLHQLFAYYEDFRKKGIEAKFDIDESPSYILADQNALERVIQNILKNILQHGKDSFEVILKQRDKKALLKFANTVESPEDIDPDMLFKNFYKADPARQHSSTGLGLSIAKSLTEKMGGNITAEVNGQSFSMQLIFPLLEEAQVSELSDRPEKIPGI